MTEKTPFEEAVKLYKAVSWPVVNGRQTWVEELARSRPPRLAWPLPTPTTLAEKFFQDLMLSDMDVMLFLLTEDRPGLVPRRPLNGADYYLQLLLRVATRARIAGERAVVAKFGGERITGRRAFENSVNELRVDHALKYAKDHSLTRDQAFELFEIPRAASLSRAQTRPHTQEVTLRA